MSGTEYDDFIHFLALGFLIRDRMEPELRERWNAGFYRVVEMRGGVEGDCYVTAIAKDVLAEVAEVGTRLYAEMLTTGLRDRQHMDESEIQRIEAGLSDGLAAALAHLEAK